MATVWQIAGGEVGRDYSDIFFNYDVMLIGPGAPGSAVDYATKYQGNAPLSIQSQVLSFARNPKPGDIVLLRVRKQVIAIGKIPDQDGSGYFWSDEFSDVMGWDLQHARRVIWYKLNEQEILDLSKVFESRLQIPTFTGVNIEGIDAIVQGYANRIETRGLRILPNTGPALSSEEIGIQLFAEGLSNDSIEDVIKTTAAIKRLSLWYWDGSNQERPTEHEVVAHCVIPLFKALGWSEQMLGVEWKRIDVAIFDRVPTTGASCIAVCEAKGLGYQLNRAYEQAKEYIFKEKLEQCRTIITVDGPRLYTFRKEPDGWPPLNSPTGYFNCVTPKRNYLHGGKLDGIKSLVSLTPYRLAHG